MNKMKKAMTYVVGATVIAGASMYFSMSKDARKNLKEMVMSMLSSNKDCCCDFED